MRTAGRRAIGFLLAGLLAGCTSAIGGSATPASVGSRLGAALAQVAPAALGTGEFGDTLRLTALAAADKQVWSTQIYAGSGPLGSYGSLTREVLGVDLARATSALTVGGPPSRLTVITGGQNQATVTAAATRSGWTGVGTLTRTLDLSKDDTRTAAVAIAAPQVRPVGADVILGGAAADLARGSAATGSGAAGAAVVAAGIGCLGDVVMAQGTGFAEPGRTPTAVGVRATSDSITSVICLGAGSAAEGAALADRVRTDLASGRSRAANRPFKELLPRSAVEVLGGGAVMVRITADTTGQSSQLIQRMLLQQDLPGQG